MKYDLIIFDMDGTILNTLEDLKNSLNYVLQQAGYQTRTLGEVRTFVGNGIRKTIERALPSDIEEEKVDELFSLFMDYYAIHNTDNTKPYNGVIELLKKLKHLGYKTAVVSNKQNSAVKSLCKKFFTGLFDVEIGEKENIAKKPEPDEVNEVLKILNIDRTKSIYIGDSEVDIQTAQNSKMKSIIVDWGFRDRKFLYEHGAEVIVSNPSEILNIINK